MTATEITEGVFPAIVTPFDADGDVDYEALGDLIARLEDAGVDGIVPCGSTGESATLTHEEHKEVVEFTVREASTPVIAGTGSNATHEALELTRHADDAGADAALLISPYYNVPNDDGLRRHYEAVADAVDIPIVLYNVPGRTGHDMPDDVVVELAGHPNVAGVKEASGEINQISRIARRTAGEDFAVVSGDDAITLPLLEVGGTGVISVTANVLPEAMCAMVDAHRAGDHERARALHRDLLPVFDAMFVETNPIPVKLALAAEGHCRSDLRLPLSDAVPEASRDAVVEAVEEFRDAH